MLVKKTGKLTLFLYGPYLLPFLKCWVPWWLVFNMMLIFDWPVHHSRQQDFFAKTAQSQLSFDLIYKLTIGNKMTFESYHAPTTRNWGKLYLNSFCHSIQLWDCSHLLSLIYHSFLFFRNDKFKCHMGPYVYHLQEKELTVSYAFLVLSMNCVLMTCRGWGIMLTGLVRLYHFSLISKHPKGP